MGIAIIAGQKIVINRHGGLEPQSLKELYQHKPRPTIMKTVASNISRNPQRHYLRIQDPREIIVSVLMFTLLVIIIFNFAFAAPRKS